MIDLLVPILIASIGAGTPLVFAALGELVTERSGVLNLGVEGMMLVGAVAAFATTFATGSTWLGVAAGFFAGVAMALLFGVVTLSLFANQVAAGLALTIFGVGLSAFAGRPYSGVALPPAPAETLPLIGSVPVLGALHPLVFLSWAVFAGVWFFLFRSRAGLALRAVGESPASARAVGFPVIRIRYLATMFGGGMAGIAGAYLALIYTRLWIDGLTAGRGWIAIALVVFASWRPGRALLGAYLFGGVTIVQYFAQGAGYSLRSEAMAALPYLATIVVLVLISRNPLTIRLNQPASLGKSFDAQT